MTAPTDAQARPADNHLDTTYSPGGWTALVGSNAVLALDRDTDRNLVDLAWPLIREAHDVSAILTLLVTGGLASLGGFALVHRSGDITRTITRGQATIFVEVDAYEESAPGAVVVSGEQAVGWSERWFAGPIAVEVVLEASTQPEDLPIESGVVRASRLMSSIGTSSSVLGRPESVSARPSVDPPVRRARRVTSRADDAQPETGVEPPSPAAAADAAEPSDRHDTIDSLTGAYDHLYSHTVHRSVEDAAVRSEEPEEVVAAVADPPMPVALGDHDGETRLPDQVALLRRTAAQGLIDSVPTGATSSQHAPPVWLHLSTGDLVQLEQVVIVGRAPVASAVDTDVMPRVITVPSPQQDVSRTHVELRRESDGVLVTDLRSTNGTELRVDGQPPRRLHSGESALVVDGTIIDIGDGVTIRVEWRRPE